MKDKNFNKKLKNFNEKQVAEYVCDNNLNFILAKIDNSIFPSGQLGLQNFFSNKRPQSNYKLKYQINSQTYS